MDGRITKFTVVMGGTSRGRQGIASVLVNRGYDPARVKAAADEELLALPGMNQSKVDLIRQYFPYLEA